MSQVEFILESDVDYREALAALDQQIQIAEQLMTNITDLATAIDKYETDNNIETPQEDIQNSV
jgi:hypothetical protein